MRRNVECLFSSRTLCRGRKRLKAQRRHEEWRRLAICGFLIFGLSGPTFAQNSSVPQPQAAAVKDYGGWSGKPGSSGDPTMTIDAIVRAAGSFTACLEGLWPDAESEGFSRDDFENAVKPLTPNLKVIDFLDAQPEFDQSIWDYLDRVLDTEHVELGQAVLSRYASVFSDVENTYGVDRSIIAAIWGVETKFGTAMHSWSVLQSTATLACIGRRQQYFRQEFIAALGIFVRGDIRPDEFYGSWTGAFGQNQMMPSTYENFAVDFDGDGRRDIVGSVPDVLASTAQYLNLHGWISGEDWGFEVSLPNGFSYGALQTREAKSISDWKALGVRLPGGAPLAGPDVRAALILPAGASGPAFLVFANYQVLFSYNPSEAYVLAVVLLADELRGRPGVQHAWPRRERMLSSAERIELQQRLAAAGYEISGTPNGRIGGGTRTAIARFESSVGMASDGFPSVGVLERLRTVTGANEAK
jgi:membrane-bound lytic murein transglycosylase B